MRTLFLILFTFCVSIINTNAQISDEYIDTVFSAFKNSPNISVVVFKNDTIAAHRHYGIYDIEKKQKPDEKTLYHLSHLTKQFTAVAIFILIQNQVININDKVINIIPDFPAYAKDVTIRDLLNHTSGLPEYKNILPAFNTTENDVFQFLTKQDSLLFKAGSKFNLCYSDYAVLTKIIEKASKTNYSKFLKKFIFKPSGMNSTFVYANGKKNKTIKVYSFKNNELYIDSVNKGFKYVIGNEGIFSTTSDYIKWEKALTSNAIINKEYYSLIFSRATLTKGSEPNTRFGYGWYNNMNNYSHYYFIPGTDDFNTNLILRIPHDKITVLILSNQNGVFGLTKRSFALARRVSKIKYVINQ